MPVEKAHDLNEKPRTEDVIVLDDVSFKDLLLSKWTLKGLEACGFTKPSPIQRKAIPLGRCGFDLIVQAKSGTGKTCVFTVVALEMIKSDLDHLQVLILSPTREISVQIQEVISAIGRCLKKLKVKSFIGGIPLSSDKQNLQKCQIAVGAPGRIKHLITEGSMKLDAVRLFVLDEADKLMEDSFRADVSFIYLKLPQTKQVIATSATFPPELEEFVTRYMIGPTRISLGEGIFLKGIRQFVTVVPGHLNPFNQMKNKFGELLRILSNVSFKQCMVFSNYQSRVESICTLLKKEDWPAIYINSSQSQTTRLQVMSRLKEFRCRVLISTDLSSRGIDAENVNLVVNYDLPYDGATYMHRIGRAGRYGTHGIAITIVQTGDELNRFQRMLNEVGGQDFQISVLPEGKLNFDIWNTKDEEFVKIWDLGKYEFIGSEEGGEKEKCTNERGEKKENNHETVRKKENSHENERTKENSLETTGKIESSHETIRKDNCQGIEEKESFCSLKDTITMYLASAEKENQKSLKLHELKDHSNEQMEKNDFSSYQEFPQEIISSTISVERAAWTEFKKKLENAYDKTPSNAIERTVSGMKAQREIGEEEEEEEESGETKDEEESEGSEDWETDDEERKEEDGEAEDEEEGEDCRCCEQDEEESESDYYDNNSQNFYEKHKTKNDSKENSLLLKKWYAAWYDQVSMVQQYVNYVKLFNRGMEIFDHP